MHPVAEQLAAVANPDYAEAMARYFQVRLGGYGEGDVFIGIRLRDLRAVAKPYAKISYRSEDWLPLIQSKVQTSPAGAVDHGRACPARHRGGTEQDIPRLPGAGARPTGRDSRVKRVHTGVLSRRITL